jgi:hypothetical protein
MMQIFLTNWWSIATFFVELSSNDDFVDALSDIPSHELWLLLEPINKFEKRKKAGTGTGLRPVHTC